MIDVLCVLALLSLSICSLLQVIIMLAFGPYLMTLIKKKIDELDR